MLSLLRLLAIREVTAHGARSALTAVGVAIGTAVVVAVLALNQSVLGGFQGMVDTLAAGADLQVRGGQAGIPFELVEKVAGVEGVAAAGAFLENWLLDPATGERILCVGVDFLADEPAPGLIDKGAFSEEEIGKLVGDPYEFLNSTDAVILNQDYSNRLPLRRSEVRRYVTPTGARELKVAGVLKDSAATRALGGSVALMSLDAAQLLFGKPDHVDVINIRVKKGADVGAIRKRIAEMLGANYTVETPDKRGARLARMMLTLTTVMRLISVVAVLVGIFIVNNTLATAVVQRRREIAIQRALGTSRRMSWLLVVLEAIVLALLGAALGAPAGLGLARSAMGIVTESISTLYTEIRPSTPDISGNAMGVVITFAVIAAALAAARPALHASRVPPAMVLAARGTTAASGSASKPARAIVYAIFALVVAWGAAQLPQVGSEPWAGYVSCLLVLLSGAIAAPAVLAAVQKIAVPLTAPFSFPVRLGAEALTRDGTRAARTAGALMLGLALYIGISGVVHSFKVTLLTWVDLAVPADLSILAGTSLPDARAVPMLPSMGDGLANDPGVATVFFQRFRTIDLGDQVTKIQAMDGVPYLSRAKLPVVEKSGDVDGKALEEGEVLVSENLARAIGVHAGDTLQLPTAAGHKGFRIRAVVEDYSSEIGSVFMDWKVYAQAFDDHKVDAFNVYVRPGVDPEVVRTRLLARYGEDRGLRVVTHGAFRNFVETVVDDAFAATRALQLVAVLIALMGIVNTLLASVLDRLREIGVLRAVGATRLQVVAMLTSEAVLMGFVASILAAAVGIGFGWVFTEVVADSTTGWRLPFKVPVRAVAESFVLAFVVSAIAAAAPARRGAGVDIITATRVE